MKKLIFIGIFLVNSAVGNILGDLWYGGKSYIEQKGKGDAAIQKNVELQAQNKELEEKLTNQFHKLSELTQNQIDAQKKRGGCNQ